MVYFERMWTEGRKWIGIVSTVSLNCIKVQKLLGFDLDAELL